MSKPGLDIGPRGRIEAARAVGGLPCGLNPPSSSNGGAAPATQLDVLSRVGGDAAVTAHVLGVADWAAAVWAAPQPGGGVRRDPPGPHNITAFCSGGPVPGAG